MSNRPRQDRIIADVEDLLRASASRPAVRVGLCELACDLVVVQLRFPCVRTLLRTERGIVLSRANVAYNLHLGDDYPLDIGIECLEPALAHPNILAGRLVCASYVAGLPLWVLAKRLYKMTIFETYNLRSPMPANDDVIAFLERYPGPTQPNDIDRRHR
jgi:hypothetical protein